MSSKGLFVRLEASPGKEAELEKFLKSGLPIVEREGGTQTWFAISLGGSSYAIFDTFADESGRDAHLGGELAKLLMAKWHDLLIDPPTIERADILAQKLPKH